MALTKAKKEALSKLRADAKKLNEKKHKKIREIEEIEQKLSLLNQQIVVIKQS